MLMSGGECWSELMLLLMSADVDGAYVVVADVDTGVEVVVSVDEWW